MACAHIVVDLGLGDQGKGSWTDHLVREHQIQYVVRYNGGAQAHHHVVAPDGREHGFAQIGSGSFVPGTMTCLSRFMLVDPQRLFKEVEVLEQKGVERLFDRLIVSENAPVITPFNRLLNRIHEVARGADKHGSCGFGIGITQGDVETLGDRALHVRDLNSPELFEKLCWLARQKLELAEEFAQESASELIEKLRYVDLQYFVDLYQSFYQQAHVVSEEEFLTLLRENDVVFEGAQGVLLDQQYGFFPHCTRSNCTFENAEQLLFEAEHTGDTSRIGLLRGYGTRHGAGPFVTEDTTLDLPSCHNGYNEWQGSFRLGWFDAVAARYALEVVGGVDTLAITNLDRMLGLKEVKVANRYQEADSRFFEREKILLPENDLKLLKLRTESMATIRPNYLSFSGLDSPADYERYLGELSELLGHQIRAYSATAKPDKVYLG